MCDYVVESMSDYDRLFMQDFDVKNPEMTDRTNVPINLAQSQSVDALKLRSASKMQCGLNTVEGHTKCKFHKCDVETCENGKCNGKYCKQHTCEYVDVCNCYNYVDENAKYCYKHKCSECDKKVLNEKVRYCCEHLKVLVCCVGGCTNSTPYDVTKVIGNSWYCDNHKCKKCGQYVVENQFSEYCYVCSGNTYECECDGHDNGGCKYGKCPNKRLSDIVEMGDLMFSTKYCEKHYFLDELYKRMYHVGLEIFENSFVGIDDIVDEHKKQILISMKKYANSMCC